MNIFSSDILPGYVIGIYSELITAINIDQACLDQINILISDVLSSKDGVSNALKTTKSCSKYAINVTMETSVRKPSDVNSVSIDSRTEIIFFVIYYEEVC